MNLNKLCSNSSFCPVLVVWTQGWSQLSGCQWLLLTVKYLVLPAGNSADARSWGLMCSPTWLCSDATSCCLSLLAPVSAVFPGCHACPSLSSLMTSLLPDWMKYYRKWIFTAIGKLVFLTQQVLLEQLWASDKRLASQSRGIHESKPGLSHKQWASPFRILSSEGL